MQTLDLASNIFSLPVCKDNQKQPLLKTMWWCSQNTKGDLLGYHISCGGQREQEVLSSFPCQRQRQPSHMSLVPCFASVVICSPAYLVGDEIHVSWKREKGKNIFPCSR